MKSFRIAVAVCTLWVGPVVAQPIVIYGGTYRLDQPKEIRLPRTERLQRCFVLFELNAGREQRSEVPCEIVVYGVHNSERVQYFSPFFTEPPIESQPRIVVQRID